MMFKDLDPRITLRVLPIGPTIHRFFDTSPFSPSGRYFGLTRFPTDERLPCKGDAAEIVVVDLESGKSQVVDQTFAWDTQLGAQVQWGRSDEELIYNILSDDAKRVQGRVKNILTGGTTDLSGEVYMVSAERGEAVSASLLHMGQKQPGYGVHSMGIADWSPSAAATEPGITVTPLDGGPARFIITISEVLERLPQLHCSGGAYVCFHTKWNPQGTRLMVAFFWMSPDGKNSRNSVLTLRPDGSDLAVALPADIWAMGGHHPNWCPNGEDILMNLKPTGEEMRLVQFHHDGSAFKILSETLRGSGHPTMHPDGRHIITDAYPYEMGENATHVPLRWVDLQTDTESVLVYVPCVPPFVGTRGELRIDPHPAWDGQFQRVAINCLDQGMRKVAIVDLSACLG